MVVERCGSVIASAMIVLVACHHPTGSEKQATSASVEAAIDPALVASDAVAPSASPHEVDDDEVDPPPALTFAEQRGQLYAALKRKRHLTDDELAAVRAVVEPSPLLGQGRPDDTTHPMTRAECRKIRQGAKTFGPDARCGRTNMVPIFDPTRGETSATAKLCIDQYEFPDIPCEYPVTYETSREAELLCRAVGERLCDAHEWEGACAGAVHSIESEYHFDAPRPYATYLHNKEREIVWAYGPKEDASLCAESGDKSAKCDATGLVHCGSNTWPAGSYPKCVSVFGVYDQHGNAAEHMNLPLKPEELTSRGGTGQTEMKGSWFASGRTTLYEDDCRWRAKDWHPSTLMTENSHRNYHLGFRCCRDIPDEHVDDHAQ